MRGNTVTDPLYLQHIYFAFRLVLKVQFQGGSICVELTIYPFVDEIFIYIKYADSIINIPETIGDKPVTAIGAKAFQSDCTNITALTMPDTITTIGDYAFSSLNSIWASQLGS